MSIDENVSENENENDFFGWACLERIWIGRGCVRFAAIIICFPFIRRILTLSIKRERGLKGDTSVDGDDNLYLPSQPTVNVGSVFNAGPDHTNSYFA